ncbi:MAG: phosphohydrolase [Flavobacteriaceae bacterium]|nr:phosphohydrolase [Flavobacteriaceae bacterium]
MNTKNKLKIFNDPIYGFITIPSTLIFDLIAHPYFQRLRRITQMGLSYLVYPGAHHTRFHHALGSLHLMQKAVRILKFKGTLISKEEENALYVAILLHDIGHGPFSHAIEHSLLEGVSHEFISLRFMEILNDEFNGQLSLAITMFKGDYKRPFFGQLISGQLDMDRSDYLKRDSFYTGVSEGNINSERLISMMNVVSDELVIEEKGIYSIEKFLSARRLMYWQVYLHKTGVVAENMIINVLKRAKMLSQSNSPLFVSPELDFFLKTEIYPSKLTKAILENFSELDDNDLVSALKSWKNHPDFVLSNLSKRLLDRQLLKIEFYSKHDIKSALEKIKKKFKIHLNLDDTEIPFFVFDGVISNIGYDSEKHPISILHKNGKTSNLNQSSELLNVKGLTKKVTQYYICSPKVML